jgi:hypothetical protein
LRSIFTTVFVAALVAAPAQSKAAAPRSIGDCEKIQAADAYNQCLALFGPLARGHGAAGHSVVADGQDTEAATGNANAEVITVSDSHRGRHHASGHGWKRHRWARHGHRRSAGSRHGKTPTLAFGVVSGRPRLR